MARNLKENRAAMEAMFEAMQERELEAELNERGAGAEDAGELLQTSGIPLESAGPKSIDDLRKLAGEGVPETDPPLAEGKQLFIVPNDDVDEHGESTFKPDLENNALHRVTNDVARKFGRTIDLSGANRSASFLADVAAGRTVDSGNHKDDNAFDISIGKNPSWFDKNGLLGARGKELVKEYLLNGFRIGSAVDHLHVDKLEGRGSAIFDHKGKMSNPKLKKQIEEIAREVGETSETEIVDSGQEEEIPQDDEFQLDEGIADQLKRIIGRDVEAGKIPEVDFDS